MFRFDKKIGWPCYKRKAHPRQILAFHLFKNLLFLEMVSILPHLIRVKYLHKLRLQWMTQDERVRLRRRETERPMKRLCQCWSVSVGTTVCLCRYRELQITHWWGSNLALTTLLHMEVWSVRRSHDLYLFIYTETLKEKGQDSEQVTALAYRKEAKSLDINSSGTKKKKSWGGCS